MPWAASWHMAFAAERWTGAVSAGSRSRDTGRMPVNDIEGARAALHAGRVADLLGLAECGWLDVKAGVYQLDDPAKSLELAKDVSAFANAKSGGVILVGYSTRKEHGEEFLAEVRPVPRALVDLDRYRKVIRELVIPVPREFTVDFIRVDDGSGILVIDVPVQPVALVPFVVPGPAGAAGSSRVSVAVPFREADATVWLPQTEIQRLLAAGWAAAGGPSQEYLNNLVEHANRTAGELARIEADREQDRMRPVLEGRVIPWPGLNDGRDHRLEIRVKTRWPLALILLNVPGDAWFSSSVHMPPIRMDFLIQFPEAGRTSALFRPGQPAFCPVRVAANPRGTVTAFAKCRSQGHDRIWEDVEVAITFEGNVPGDPADAMSASEPGPGPGEQLLPSGTPIVLRGGPASGRQVMHTSHPEDYIGVVSGVRHAWRHTDPQAIAPPDRTRPVYDYVGPIE